MMATTRYNLWYHLLVVVGVTLLLSSNSHAFVPQSLQTASFIAQGGSKLVQTTTFSSLRAGLFGGDGILGGIFGSKGPKTVIEIPAKDVKIGALRFLLQIHLVGEQNKPVTKSWMTRQGDEAGDLQVYYQDGTGMLSIQLQEYAIKMVRYGERPSLQYQLQESVLLHSVLDELSNVALGVADDNVAQEKRLLQLLDDSAIESARAKLPARQA
jgi:hypothetical protein